MSDLQDAIASTSIKAFNSGYLRGTVDEHKRIIELIEAVASKSLELTATEPKSKDNVNRQKLAAVCYHLASLIKGEQK